MDNYYFFFFFSSREDKNVESYCEILSLCKTCFNMECLFTALPLLNNSIMHTLLIIIDYCSLHLSILSITLFIVLIASIFFLLYIYKTLLKFTRSLDFHCITNINYSQCNYNLTYIFLSYFKIIMIEFIVYIKYT